VSATLRLLLVLLGLALPGGVLLYANTVSAPQALSFEATISPELAGYRQNGEERLAADVLRQIEPDHYLMWHYAAAGQPPLWSYVAFYRGIVFTGAHDPAVCYPAQGWDITEARNLQIAMLEGGPLAARLLKAHRQGREELVLYWFQPVGRWPGAAWAEQLLRVYDSLLGTPQYAFVRLSAPARPDTEDALVRFARGLGPQVRQVLESAKPTQR
jgi:EpsI family protein